MRTINHVELRRFNGYHSNETYDHSQLHFWMKLKDYTAMLLVFHLTSKATFIQNVPNYISRGYCPEFWISATYQKLIWQQQGWSVTAARWTDCSQDGCCLLCSVQTFHFIRIADALSMGANDVPGSINHTLQSLSCPWAMHEPCQFLIFRSEMLFIVPL